MEQSATSKRHFTEQDNFVSWKVPPSLAEKESVIQTAAAVRDEQGDLVYQRFYHVFKEGELNSLILEAGGELVESGYDRDNWWAVCKRKSM